MSDDGITVKELHDGKNTILVYYAMISTSTPKAYGDNDTVVFYKER